MRVQIRRYCLLAFLLFQALVVTHSHASEHTWPVSGGATPDTATSSYGVRQINGRVAHDLSWGTSYYSSRSGALRS